MARDKGSGTVFYDAARDRWIGRIEVGWSSKGTRRRATVSAKTKREALQKLQDKRRALAVAGPTTEGTQQQTTVKAFADQWLMERASSVDPGTFVADRSAVNLWIIPTIGKKRLSLITARDIRAVSRAILASGKSASTASRYQAVLVKMLKDAARDGYPITQSALLAEGISVGKPDTTAIDHDDVRAILAEARQEPDYSRWLAAFLAGLRPAEARGLTWDRVNFDLPALEISWQLKALPYQTPRDRTSGFRVPIGYESIQLKNTWHLVRPKTDAGDRWIPMHSALKEALKEWREACPDASPGALVWPNLTGEKSRAYGGPREDKPDRAVWKRLCAQARVPDYDLYATRHTTASLLKAQGVSDEIITAIMGHTSIKSTAAYIHTKLADAARELERATKTLQLPG